MLLAEHVLVPLAEQIDVPCFPGCAPVPLVVPLFQHWLCPCYSIGCAPVTAFGYAPAATIVCAPVTALGCAPVATILCAPVTDLGCAPVTTIGCAPVTAVCQNSPHLACE